MVELKFFIYSTIESISLGQPFVNSKFRAKAVELFPNIKLRLVFAFEDAVSIIYEYNKSIDMSDFEWLREREFHPLISTYNHRVLVSNLKNILQIIEEDLNL